MITTWRDRISYAMEEHGETLDDVTGAAPAISAGWLDVEFDDGWGRAEGAPFTLWTSRRVYFPVVYDGSEWAASVPRRPCREITDHVGGQ